MKGFGIVEVIIAMSLFIIIATTGVVTVVHTFSTNRLGDEKSIGTLYAQEGIEAIRSIKNQSWASVTNGTHGISNSSNYWAFSGTSNTNGKYTRVLTVSDVARDGNGTIVESGGTVDPDTKRVTSTVSWSFSPTRPNTVSIVQYFTDWKKPVDTDIGNWGSPSQIAFEDLTGGKNNLEVTSQGNYAYVARDSASLNFVPIDVSNSSDPVALTEYSVPENPNDVAVSGNYAYIASKSNTQELQVVSIANPSSPSTVTQYNVDGTADGRGLSLLGSNLYMVRGVSSEGEFLSFDVSAPASPVLIGLINLGDTGNGVVVLGNYAYVASSSDTQEVQVINITNPGVPVHAGSYNISGTGNMLTIAGFSTTIVVGRDDGILYLFSVSSPTVPVLQGTFNATDSINDISLGNNNAYAFLATNAAAKEFQIVDISIQATPTLVGSVNTADVLNGVKYDVIKDVAYAVSDSNSQDFIILGPQ